MLCFYLLWNRKDRNKQPEGLCEIVWLGVSWIRFCQSGLRECSQTVGWGREAPRVCCWVLGLSRFCQFCVFFCLVQCLLNTLHLLAGGPNNGWKTRTRKLTAAILSCPVTPSNYNWLPLKWMILRQKKPFCLSFSICLFFFLRKYNNPYSHSCQKLDDKTDATLKYLH